MDTKERVEWLLKNYHEIKRYLDRLNFEIERFSGVSYEQVIESLNFNTPEGERVQTSSISDKSGRISLMYREQAESLNADIKALIWEYHEKKSEMDVLDYCICLLEPWLSDIITDMFINKMTWDKICDKYHIAQTTLARYRKNGISQIAKNFVIKGASLKGDGKSGSKVAVKR